MWVSLGMTGSRTALSTSLRRAARSWWRSRYPPRKPRRERQSTSQSPPAAVPRRLSHDSASTDIERSQVQSALGQPRKAGTTRRRGRSNCIPAHCANIENPPDPARCARRRGHNVGAGRSRPDRSFPRSAFAQRPPHDGESRQRHASKQDHGEDIANEKAQPPSAVKAPVISYFNPVRLEIVVATRWRFDQI